MAEKLKNIGIVTGNQAKARVFDKVLSSNGNKAIYIPSSPDERRLSANFANKHTRPLEVSHAKAMEWLSNGFAPVARENELQIALFNDVCNYVPSQNVVLEKPETYEEWLRQVMLQSDQEVWILAGNTGVLLADNFLIKTFGVVTKVRTKEITPSDLEAKTSQIGWEKLASAAGGLPLAQVPDFYRRDLPLTVFLTDQNGQTSLLESRSHWFDISQEQLQQCVTGAHPYALKLLFNDLTSATNQPTL